MRKSKEDQQLFAVTVERYKGKQLEVFLVRARDREAAKRQGAWVARVPPEKVIGVSPQPN